MEDTKYLPELLAEKDSLDSSFTHAMKLISAGTVNLIACQLLEANTDQLAIAQAWRLPFTVNGAYSDRPRPEQWCNKHVVVSDVGQTLLVENVPDFGKSPSSQVV